MFKSTEGTFRVREPLTVVVPSIVVVPIKDWLRDRTNGPARLGFNYFSLKSHLYPFFSYFTNS